jgi:CRP/FNR family transcriptional regulator, cyclic AMP receptor protein
VEADIARAVALSHLGALPPGRVDPLVATARRATIPAGAVIHWVGEDVPHVDLVVSGVVRAFVTAPDGRAMTVRYARVGALLGIMSLYAPGFALPATVQALTDAVVLRFPPHIVRQSADRDVEVAKALLVDQAERALAFLKELPGSAFASVTQRVVRHLLDLASHDLSQPERPTGPHVLVAQVTQSDLADAVGSVREVVVRVLRQLRDDGLIETGRDGIVIIDPERLVAKHGWNAGS